VKNLKIGQTIKVNQQVKDHQMLTKCPECGKSVDGNDSFCRNCGVKMAYEGKEDRKGEKLDLNIVLDPKAVPNSTHPGIVNSPMGPTPSITPHVNPGIPGGGTPMAKLTALANRVASFDHGRHRDCAERILKVAKANFGGKNVKTSVK
jgi:predicted RNA-binding Zn-ribbon protein involved in translation (DUF1610 family)